MTGWSLVTYWWKSSRLFSLATATFGIQKDLKKLFWIVLVSICLGHFKKAHLLKDRNEMTRELRTSQYLYPWGLWRKEPISTRAFMCPKTSEDATLYRAGNVDLRRISSKKLLDCSWCFLLQQQGCSCGLRKAIRSGLNHLVRFNG